MKDRHVMQTGQARLKPISALAALTMLAGFAGCQTTKFADPVTNPESTDGAPIPEKWQDAAAAPDDAKTIIERSTLRERALATLTEYTASNNALLRANALEALSPAGKRLQAPLAAGLVDPNEGVRAIAALLVGREEVKPLAASVRPLLADESPRVRASAIYALRAVGADVDPTPLGAFLLESPDTGVRAHAAFLFGELGDKTAMPLLRQALHSSVPGATEQQERVLGLQIAEAMVKLGDKSRLEGLRAALYPARPEEFEIAVLATQILGRLGDRASIPQLINLSEYTQNGRTVPARAPARRRRRGRPDGPARGLVHRRGLPRRSGRVAPLAGGARAGADRAGRGPPDPRRAAG
jgi:HEAT repeat protein